MPVVIGVVGGTRGQGRALVDELKSHTGQYTTKIFSRKTTGRLTEDYGAPVISLDFNNVEAMAEALVREEVHTVFCCIGILSEEAHKAQLNLLHACELSKSTKRFVPSTFDAPYDQEMAKVLYTGQFKLDLERELMLSKSLEWTRYHNGFYSDYFFSSEKPTRLTPGKYVIDLDKKKVIIPGDGNAPVTFTHTTDVAKFVVASLQLKAWPTRQYIFGEQLSWNQFVDKAESISGTKFERSSNDLETLRTGDLETLKQLEGWEVLYEFWPKSLAERLPSAIQYFMATGRLNIRDMGGFVLNEQFPDIRPLTIEDALIDYYS